jgi:hypothetical protein
MAIENNCVFYGDQSCNQEISFHTLLPSYWSHFYQSSSYFSCRWSLLYCSKGRLSITPRTMGSVGTDPRIPKFGTKWRWVASHSLDRGSERRGLKNLSLHAPNRIRSHNINDRAIENRAGTTTYLLFQSVPLQCLKGINTLEPKMYLTAFRGRQYHMSPAWMANIPCFQADHCVTCLNNQLDHIPRGLNTDHTFLAWSDITHFRIWQN